MSFLSILKHLMTYELDQYRQQTIRKRTVNSQEQKKSPRCITIVFDKFGYSYIYNKLGPYVPYQVLLSCYNQRH